MSNVSRLKQAVKSRLSVRPPVDNDPRLLSSGTKGLVIVVLAMCAASSGFASTIYFPGIPNITIELNAPSISTTLTAALYILFMGLTPILWASISDYYQIRRFLLILSMVIFAFASLGSALVNNIWGLVVLRCVQAFGASCGQSVGAGVIADCYPIERRGAAFGKYFFGVFFGPVLGPILGGFLIMSDSSWRTAFWFCFAFALTVLLLVIFTYPETYRVNEKWDIGLPMIKESQHDEKNQKNNAITTKEEDDELHADSEDTQVSVSIEEGCDLELTGSKQHDAAAIYNKVNAKDMKKKPMNPIKPFLYLRHPHVLLSSLVMACAFGSMFAAKTIIPNLFERAYGFSSWQIGLSYLGGGVGNVFGAVLNTVLSDRLLLRARAKRGGRALVEDRIGINIWPSILILMPFGLLLFGWGVGSQMSYWTGIIGFAMVNFSMNQCVTTLSAYLVDSAPGVGASFTAAANSVRMIMACVLTLAANPMVDAIGPGWTCVFLTGLICVAMVLLIILKIFGGRLRRWSGYQQKNECD